jgi:hypothetical protein
MKLTLSGQTAVNLSLAVNEMDVGYHYREFLSRKIQGLNFTSPFKCDGFGEHENLKIRLLCEFKENVNLKNKLEFATVLAQAIYYVKKFELTGLKLPTTILLGDRDECCVLHTNDIIEYLAMSFDWEIAPSSVDKHNLELIKMISDNEKINPFIFSVNQLDDILEKIVDLTENVKRLIPITNHNITGVFNYFEENILGKTSLNTNELANLFVQILVNPIENYLHPVNKVSALVTKNFNQVPIKNRKNYQSFFEHFKSEYTPREKEILTSIVDRLVRDMPRRMKGEFFTSTIWADKAHEYIASVFGEDWKEKYVVWDPAWGTGNLTRDYRFKELYCSTINQSDIDTANQMGFNSEAVKFQFDFLNDPDEKLPQGLKDAIKSGREIIVFMNPPYGTANSAGANSKHKSGIASTNINKLMKNENWGKSSQQLYAQFLFKLTKLNSDNIKLCLFSPPLFLSGGSYKEFRKKFLNFYGFKSGFLMNAKEFDGTSDWGISFTIWSNKNDIKNSFDLNVLKSSNLLGIEHVCNKIIYNLDEKYEASKWVRKELKGIKTFDAPQLSSAMICKQNGQSNLVNNSIGYFGCASNAVYKNATDVSLFTAGYSVGHGLSVVENNFYKVSSLFSARKLIKPNWINQKDEYITPNENHECYQQFTNDSIVYSLFNNSSQQSSLRQITYKEKLWDVKNEFFWMSKEEMLNLANENSYSDLYNDARTDSDRHVYKLLFGEEKIYDKLSPDARLLIDKATELVKKSMPMREAFANDDNHLNSWDAGYAQLKLLWKEYYSEDFKEFRELYKNLEDRMRPLVYELGFLMK